ncbi:MAG: HlyD family efflux transporter periplasmic adaptor subunit [Chloroflexi bacterium]|nr:HlyD family efflux transporter periplasmic adaptor subunit [Chloroflexota bacterium]
MIELPLRQMAPVGGMVLLVGTAVYVHLTPTPGVVTTTPPEQIASPSTAEPRRGPGAEAAVGASPSAPAQAASDRVVVARRGTVMETMTLAARITGREEVPVGFPGPQRIATVLVKPGDTVTAGQVLVEADERELARSLAAARARLDAARTKFEQAEAAAARQQRLAERKQHAEQARQDKTIADAEAAVRRADADYHRVRAGASPSERRAAETAVASARAAAARAEADLVQARQGPDELTLRQVDQQVLTAQVSLQRAEQEFARLNNGPDQTVVRAAEREYISAQNALTRIQLDLQRASQPDPIALAAAERDVQRAQATLRLAELNARTRTSSTTSDGGKTSRNASADRLAELQKRAAVLDAQLALQAALDKLEAVRAGPPPGEVAILRRSLGVAQSQLEAARARLEEVRQGPAPTEVVQAQTAVDTARMNYETAVARAAAARSGPSDETLTAAMATFESARLAQQSAEAQLAEVNARPTQAELTDASERLSAAQAALTQVQADAGVPPDTTEPQDSNTITLLRQMLDQEQAQVQALEVDLSNIRVFAPFDGVAVSVLVRPQDGVDAGKPVAMLARSGDPVVRSDVPRADAARLSTGQTATVRYSGAASVELVTTVADLVDTGGDSLTLTVAPPWPAVTPAFGTAASLVVVTGERRDVVVVPRDALHGTDRRQQLTVLTGDGRRTMVDIVAGLVGDGQAEIVSGIEPGASVLVGP